MFAFVNASVIDGTGAAPRKRQRVLIDDGRIVAVGSRVRISAGVPVTDLEGRILMPGLWEGHAHFGGVPKGELQSREQSGNYADMRNICLRYGITSVRSMGDHQADTLRLRDEIDRGKLIGPKLYCSGRTFCREDSHPACTGWAGKDEIKRTCGYLPKTPDEARAMVREGAGEGLDLFKIIVSSGHVSIYPRTLPVIEPEIVKAIIDEAHRCGRPVACHVDTLDQARMVVEYDADEVHHLIAEGSKRYELHEYEPLFLEMCRKNTWFIPTVAIGMQNEENRIAIGAADGGTDQKLPVFKMAYEYGVRFAVGTDAGISVMNWGVSTHDEIIQLSEAVGMTPLEAIRCATLNGAATMHRDGESGIIKAGAQADLLILDKDPSEDIRNISSVNRVLKGGVTVYDASLKQDEYVTVNEWPDYKSW